MSIVNILAEDKKLVTYRPRLNEITGSVTATVLLQQIIFHSDNVGYRSFYKFRSPCSHKLYREGDSWTEELGFSPAEFDTARSKIATRVMKGGSKTEALMGETASHLVVYWTDASRVTWYLLNVDLLNRMLEKLYANSRNSNYQEIRETPNSVIQESEITRKLEKPELPLSEITTETTIEDAEKTPGDFPKKPKLDYLSHLAQYSDVSESSYADPPSAGGAFALGDQLIAIYCQHIGEALPEGGELIAARATFSRVLKRKKLSQDGIMAERGLRVLLDSEGEWSFHFGNYAISGGENRSRLFETHYGKVLARLKAGGDGYSERHRAKTPPRNDPDKFDRARAMTLERLERHGDQ